MYPLRLVHDLRPALPWTVYSLPVAVQHGSPPAVQERRFAIQWDEDNDERIVAAVLDVFFRSPAAFWNLYAVGERKGNLTIWASKFPVADQVAWQSAIAGPAIQDSWAIVSISAHAEILRTGGFREIEKMADIVPRKFPREHDQLNWLINLFGLGPSGAQLPW